MFLCLILFIYIVPAILLFDAVYLVLVSSTSVKCLLNSLVVVEVGPKSFVINCSPYGPMCQQYSMRRKIAKVIIFAESDPLYHHR